MKKDYKYNLISVFSVLIFLIFWEYFSLNSKNINLYFGKPTLIFIEFIEFFSSNEILLAILESLKALMAGFILSVFIGVLIGIALGANKRMYYTLRPFIFAINTIPLISFLPLVLIVLGVGEKSKIFIIFLMGLMPILINTIGGVRNVDNKLIEMTKAFEVPRAIVFKVIYFYGSLPYILSGMKIAFGKAFIGLIVAEFYGFGRGIGYYISFYGLTYKPNKLMALILLILLLNLLVINIINSIENRYLKFYK